MDVCTGSIGAITFTDASKLTLGCSTTGLLILDPKDGLVEQEIPVDTDGFQYSALYGGNIYTVAENPNGGNPRVHLVDLTTNTETDNDSFPTTLGYGSANDMERVGNFLILTHGSTSISKVDPTSGGATRDLLGPTIGTCTDVLGDTSSSNALIAGGTGGVYRFLFASNEIQFAATGADVDDATALTADEDWLWVADAGSDSLKSFSYNAGGATMGSDLQDEVPLGEGRRIVEMVSAQEYLILGSDDGMIVVVGDAPWVEAGVPNPETLEENTDFEFTINSSESGEYRVLLNATSNESGTELISGTVVAGEELTVELTPDSDYLEGDNTLRVVVRSGEREGHDSVVVTVDTPPSTPTLLSTEVGFGDGLISISSTTIVDSDLEQYLVYVSTTEFFADEYSMDGPILNGFEDANFTIDVNPSESYEWSLTGRNNGTTYYVAVRALDAAGAQSPLSAIYGVTPQETLSASQLAGETGGFCGIQTRSGWFGVASVLLGLFIRRRKRMNFSSNVLNWIKSGFSKG